MAVESSFQPPEQHDPVKSGQMVVQDATICERMKADVERGYQAQTHEDPYSEQPRAKTYVDKLLIACVSLGVFWDDLQKYCKERQLEWKSQSWPGTS